MDLVQENYETYIDKIGNNDFKIFSRIFDDEIIWIFIVEYFSQNRFDRGGKVLIFYPINKYLQSKIKLIASFLKETESGDPLLKLDKVIKDIKTIMGKEYNPKI